MIDIVLFGIQGSGKGTQAALLNEKFKGKFSYFSSGDLFRALVKTPNPIGEYVDHRIKNGELIDDRVTKNLFRAYFYTVIDEQKGMLVDGYPRSSDQLDDIFAVAKENKRTLVGLWYQVPDEIVKERMKLRGRDDDTDESIQKRIDQFYEKTMPVIEYFQKNAELIAINADDTIESIHANSVNALMKFM